MEPELRTRGLVVRRTGIIELTGWQYQALTQTHHLRLPDDVRVCAAARDPRKDCIVVQLEGEGLPESYDAEEGGEYPLICCEVPKVSTNDISIPTITLLYPVETKHITE